MLAIALGLKAVHAGYRVYYTTAADLVARTASAAIEGRWQTTMRFWNGPQLLVDRRARLSADARRSRQPPLPSHHAAATSTARSSSPPTAGSPSWGEIFEDTTVAVAILDRLLHHATVLQIDGESYRMRGHRARLQQLRAGLNQGGEKP